jgi:hypothetical protein
MSEVNSTAGYPFAAAALDYCAGGWSINALADKHKIPEATLRRFAKKHEWVSGNEQKRGMVREALAGLALSYDETMEKFFDADELRQHQLDEATQDVTDMRLGLHVARSCMAKLLVMVQSVELPKDVKLIVESNKLAVETIRKIRSLDDDPAPEAAVNIEINDGFAELRAAFRKRLETINPAAAADAADPA